MDTQIQEGDIINDAYKVERVIGAGGMAVVVAALDLHHPRRVAIKVLFRKAAGSPEVLKRFEREQRVVQQLRGPHVVRLLDFGIYKNGPYMVMDYLQGSNLAELLRVQGPLPVDQAVEYLLQTCEAVAEAHGRDIVHRDLKPGNLFLTRAADGAPCIKVLDFGIAKVLAPDRPTEESTLTKTTTVMGSPFYMSPEQVISPRSVGPPSDIWSLGIILYELIAGKIPFAAKSPEKVCARVLNDPPDPMSEHRDDCPPELEAAIVKCLQRRPDSRHRDIALFAKAIAPFGPPHARDAPARISRILVKPETAGPARDSSHDLVSARDGAEAPEAPTVYIPAPKSVLSGRTALMLLFGIAMLGVGFAGGFLMRARTPLPPAPSVGPSTPPTVSPEATASSAPTAEPDPSAAWADIPIEMDLDEEAARLAAQRRMEMRRRRDAEADADPSGTTESAADASAPATTATPTGTRTSAPPAATPERTAPTSTSTSGSPPTSTSTRPAPTSTSTSTSTPGPTSTSAPTSTATSTSTAPAATTTQSKPKSPVPAGS